MYLGVGTLVVIPDHRVDHLLHPSQLGENMGSKSDDLKGRAKEAVGDLTDNDDLKREGQADRASGKAKDVIDDLGEKAKAVVDDIKDKVQGSDND